MTSKFQVGDLLMDKQAPTPDPEWKIVYMDYYRVLLVEVKNPFYDWKTTLEELEENYMLVPKESDKMNSKFKVGDMVVLSQHKASVKPRRILYMDARTVLLEPISPRFCGSAVLASGFDQQYELHVVQPKPLEVGDIVSYAPAECDELREIVFLNEDVILMRKLDSGRYATYGIEYHLPFLKYEDGSEVGKPVFN